MALPGSEAATRMQCDHPLALPGGILFMGGKSMRTVFWEDNQVKMIDQRLLPGELVIAEFDTVAGWPRSIREMYVRGAPAIGATGAYGMAWPRRPAPATDRGDAVGRSARGQRRRWMQPDRPPSI